MAEFFTANITYVFFIYGLAFFTMGLAVALEMGRATQLRIRPCLPWLAAFGLIHGMHEWVEMLQLLHKVEITPAIEAGRLITLGLSFICLLIFGSSLLYTLDQPLVRPRTITGIITALCLAGMGILYSWGLSTTEWLHACDAWIRYSLGISGAAITSWALILQGRQFIRQGSGEFGRDLIWASAAFACYGVIGQLFVGKSAMPPTTIINKELFLQLLGFPIQVFRAAMASGVAVAMIRALRIFEAESRQQLADMQEMAIETERRMHTETARLNQQLQEREVRLSELLHKMATAQEEERKRIARELHDETAQAFTALALGLSGIQETFEHNPALARQQITHLQTLSTRALEDLRQFVADLRPSQLDDLGLVPAIHWLLDELRIRLPGVNAHFHVKGQRHRLSPEIETILFRITQEAMSNVIRHAKAQQVDITLTFAPGQAHLAISDDGIGFEPEQILGAGQRPDGQACLGLIGIQERVASVNGQFNLYSAPGRGTRLAIQIPLIEQEISHEHHSITAS